ncbi:conserved hypothetical protein [Streptomyces sp. Mg1]|nr:hypothetical protein M444_38095 [Streptomyces sp. Mg1]EDX25086.1 conserved hypothetical protein [Streptomyces sp. Mg1]
MECQAQATVLREGPAQDPGPGAAWLAYLCPVHAADLGGWPGAADHPDTGTMSCGTVLDYRSGEQQLQSRADLWLTSLTGVDSAAQDGWAHVLDQADRVLLARRAALRAWPAATPRTAGSGRVLHPALQAWPSPRLATTAPVRHLTGDRPGCRTALVAGPRPQPFRQQPGAARRTARCASAA